MKPKFPVYVISKGRFENCLTAKFLIKDKCPFSLVVEPQEADEYKSRYGEKNVLVLPFSNLGLGFIPARNWCWEDSIAKGHERHWILDDNISSVARRYKAHRYTVDSKVAFKVLEDFTERYENIGIMGMNYSMFVPDKQKIPPFRLNVHVYSCLLILNSMKSRWRGRYNEDTDLCLQVLASGLCTVLTNAFMIKKIATMTMKGGNMETLYKADGRLKMARSLERARPYIATVGRRFNRPQHKIKNQWAGFDTQLKRKSKIKNSTVKNNEYGMKIYKVKEIKSKKVQKLLEDFNE